MSYHQYYYGRLHQVAIQRRMIFSDLGCLFLFVGSGLILLFLYSRRASGLEGLVQLYGAQKA